MISPDYYIQQILGEARELSTASEDELMRSKRKAWWQFNAAVMPDNHDSAHTKTYIGTLLYAHSCVSHVSVTEECTDREGCIGLYHPGEDSIWVWSGLNKRGRIRTLIHELAHWITWPNPPDVFTDIEAPQRYREQVAEAIAFTVGKWLGIDTHDYSLNYIALCLKGADRHITKVSGIYRCCSTIYAGINARRVRING